jgi:hypothetical protein
MTREDIIRMAREICDLYRGDPYDKDCGTITMYPEELERIIAQAVEAKREACAEICDAEATIEGIAQRCAANIRARGSK